MTFSDFKSFIEKHAANYNSEQWFFAQHRDGYSAQYAPRFPEKTAADFSIFGCDEDCVWTLYAETSCVPILRTFKSSEELASTLQNMDVCEVADSGTNPDPRQSYK